MRNHAGEIEAILMREQQSVAGGVKASAVPVGEGLYRLRVTVENHTSLEFAGQAPRDHAMLHSLASTHTILGVRNGEFCSLIDPPEECREPAAACRNEGTWPVLVGRNGEKDTLLSSPITLYDYPQIAPESPGEFFDGTEMDEMLVLRVLTLTDEERNAVAAVDERARALLARTSSMSEEQMMGLHGTVRGLRMAANRSTAMNDWNAFFDQPRLASLRVNGIKLKPGDRVRLRPQGRADILDMALDGKTATIEAIEQDFEERVYLGVILDDDPGRDLGKMRQPGHCFFFGVDEVEPFEPSSNSVEVS